MPATRPTPARSPFTTTRARTGLAVAAGVTAGGVLAAPAAFAHPGHLGGIGDGLAHPVTGVDHLLAIVAVGVLAALAGSRRLAWATPVAFVAGLLGGAAVGMVAGEVAGVEWLVAASVVLLGVIVVTGPGRSGLWVPFVAAGIGAVHGVAHGAELPAGASPVAYAAGFVVATAVLCAAGAAAGRGLRNLPALRLGAGAALCSAGAALLLGLG